MRCYATRPPLAGKYCFCVRSTIVDGSSRKPLGIIFGYGLTANLIGKRVEHVAIVMQKEEPGLCCEEVELLLHEVCPVELSDDVYVHMFKSPALEGYDSEMAD